MAFFFAVLVLHFNMLTFFLLSSSVRMRRMRRCALSISQRTVYYTPRHTIQHHGQPGTTASIFA